MASIFSDLLKSCMKVFMDDFTIFCCSFDGCLDSLSRVLDQCIEVNLVLNFEKCHFMVHEGIVLVMQSYPPRALDKRLQEDWAKNAREGPRVLMSLRIDFRPMG